MWASSVRTVARGPRGTPLSGGSPAFADSHGWVCAIVTGQKHDSPDWPPKVMARVDTGPQQSRTPPSIPGYDVLRELGRGGMGIVYEARQHAPARPVALKLLNTGRGAHYLELARFRIEAAAVACVAHPNIMQIHEVGLHAGFPYLVLEFVPGGNLADRIRNRPQPPRWGAQIAATVALAIQHAHERGILHRDLKPENILLTESDVPKVSDFGLAKFTSPDLRQFMGLASIQLPYFAPLQEGPAFASAIEQEALAHAEGPKARQAATEMLWKQCTETLSVDLLTPEDVRAYLEEAERQLETPVPEDLPELDNVTRAGQVLGTPQYMAPEQFADSARIGPRTDVYALGVVLYEMLTGRMPFRGHRGKQIFDAILKDEPPPIDTPVAWDLKTICLTCLQKDPSERYASAADLAEDLDRYLQGFAVRGSGTRGGAPPLRYVEPTREGPVEHEPEVSPAEGGVHEATVPIAVSPEAGTQPRAVRSSHRELVRERITWGVYGAVEGALLLLVAALSPDLIGHTGMLVLAPAVGALVGCLVGVGYAFQYVRMGPTGFARANAPPFRVVCLGAGAGGLLGIIIGGMLSTLSHPMASSGIAGVRTGLLALAGALAAVFLIRHSR